MQVCNEKYTDITKLYILKIYWVYTKDTGLKYAIYTRAYIYKYIYMWGCPATAWHDQETRLATRCHCAEEPAARLRLRHMKQALGNPLLNLVPHRGAA